MVTTDSQTPPEGTKHRVFVVDDHPIVREGLTKLVAHVDDIEVCGGADNAADAVRQVKELCPDLVTVDICLKEGRGINLISQIRAIDHGIKMLVYSMYDEKTFAEQALRAGAMGYVSKQEPLENVLDAMRRVLAGHVYLSTATADLVLRHIAAGESVEQDCVCHLSARELEIFKMIGRGMTSHEIAEELGVSPKTVATHRENLKAKLSANNAAELNRRAIHWMLENG